MMKKITLLLSMFALAFVLLPSISSAQIAGNDTTLGCNGATVNLGSATPMWSFPTSTPLAGDDNWSPTTVPIGFTFNFFGTNYNVAVPSTNGVLSFQASYAGTAIPWVITNPTNMLPSAGTTPRNAIMGPWQDLYNVTGVGTASYGTLGTAPNRIFVIEMCTYPYYSCTSILFSGQMLLYETTNVIEVHIVEKPVCAGWNGGRAVEGIQNATGTVGFTVPGRNATTFTAYNDAWRFTPTGPSTYLVTPCAFNPVYLDPTPPTISWYQLPDTTTVIGTGNPFSITASTTTSFLAKSNASCTGGVFVDTVTITVNSNIVPISNVAVPGASGTSITLCAGASTSLSATGGGPGGIYSWSPVLGLSNPNDSITMANITSTIQYVVTVENSFGCLGYDTVDIFVQPLVAVTVSPANSTVCTGGATTLTASGAAIYNWAPAAGLSATTGSSVVATPATTTTYTVTGTTPGCLGALSAYALIVVNPIPSLTYSPPSPLSICEGLSNTLNVTSSVAGTNFTWSPGTGLDNPNSASPVFSGTTSTTYTITADANGCMFDSLYSVVVNPTPTVAWPALVPNTFCESNAPFVLSGGTGIPLGGSGSYSGAGVSLGSFDPSLINAPPDTPVPTTVWFTYTDLFGCYDSVSNVITVVGNPDVTLTSDINPICFNDPGIVTFTGTPAGGVYSGTGLNPAGSNTFSPTALAGVAAAGIYTITYQYTNIGGCTGTSTVDEIVWALPVLSIDGVNAMYCVVDPLVSFNATPSGGSFTLDGTPASSLLPASTSPGSHLLVYDYTDANGCSNSTSQNVAINELPVLSFSGLSSTYCQYDAPVELTGSPSGTSGSFSGNGISGSTFDPSVASIGANIITYTYTAPATGCTNSTSNTSYIIETPTALFVADPFQTTIVNPLIDFHNGSLLADSSDWDFGDDIGISDLMNPSYLYNDTGVFAVRLIVSNQGCLDTLISDVAIVPSFMLYMPSAFTPNDDNKNDTFFGFASGVAQFEMKIFDRWGNQIFHGKTIAEAWTGTNAPAGVYVYKINARDLEGKPYEYVGQISLIR